MKSQGEYNAEFNEMLAVAQTMMAVLRDREDFEVCEKWITRAKKLQSRDKNVLKNRNAFIKYLVGLIRETLELTGDSPSCCLWGKPPPGVFDKPATPPKPMPYQCHWTPDKRTYVAVQPLPNRGALVYMAVAEKPELGWDFPVNDD